MRHRALLLFATLVLSSFVFAQPRPQTSPGVGNAVLLATNSILIDNAATVLSGDVIVNNAANGPILGSAALDLGNAVHTPGGYKLAARSVALGNAVAVGGDVYYNTLTNHGTISGTQFTPLALPVFATLPPVMVRPAGTTNVTVANGGSTTLAEGAYGDLVVGNSGTVHLSGGAYAFRSITIKNSSAIRFAAPTDIVVSGRIDFGNSSLVQAENGSGLTPASIRIQVDGINGTSGALTATPPAAHVANAGKVFANLYVTAGSLNLDNAFEGTGAFIARDIHAAQSTKFTINSAFNLAPVANPQSVSTSGSSPLLITLTGSDPEGGPLTFSVVSGPGAGTLSTPVQMSPTSANVTYSPTSANVADSFTFRVRDTAGATGDAIVTINAQTEDQPPTPTTVVATDDSAQTAKDVPATLLLRGTAPAGVALTFSIVSSTGPFHGSLGTVTQGSEVPERSATVVYTPDAGYVGPDSFQFRACGIVGSTNVCDDASFSITVQPGLADPPPSIAHDVSVSTIAETSIDISLGDTSIQGFRRLLPVPRAATLDAAEIAGNVADSDANGFGDNANALPGLTPVFMSAGVNQAGGAGSNGTVRMQFEWNMSSIIGSVGALQSAVVILPTHRGTVDSLDTTFYWVAASGDGNLTNSDFESPAERISDAVMPVPPTMPIGGDGTFSFSVLDQIRAAAQNGYTFFAIQGRVNESASGPARGLEVRTTAVENVNNNDVPAIALATPGISASLLYRIDSLPANGVLRDSTNAVITTVPYSLPSPQVNYAPNTGFVGFDTFSFNVSNGVVSSGAIGTIHVVLANCQDNVKGCNNGR